ncbi:MAG: sigma-54-dependent Fis family transcriptional regulator [Candidatus Marinimicrobia bacterium]|nr:sigma-54-dependent Fis family transcriptional regulator [Candidatus Neomarinimicrobiota bacterium]
MKDFSILVVDDDENIRHSLDLMLSSEGFKVTTCASAQTALEVLEGAPYPLVISDIMMPGMSGVELLKKVKSINVETVVVLMTGYSSIKGAIEAIQAGAQDYLIKPINPEDVMLMVARNYQQFKKNQRAEMMRQEITRNKTVSIIGNSPGIKQVKNEIAQVAPVNLSVLITGESGTGKELVARAVHDLSARKDELFVAINCASIPSDLLESELFGHEKGAFSGAVSRKYGLFEIADKGTILLDEVGEMPIQLQPKILRAIETGIFRRLGSTQEIISDFRIISSTNRNLEDAILEKQFRSDLYFRLNQFRISVPPLRERKSDIPALVDFYALKKKRPDSLSTEAPECIEMLKQYHWPGNVRQLFNALDRAFLYAGESTLLLQHFAAEISLPSVDKSDADQPHKLLADIENEYILKMYYDMGQNRTRTANALGISLRSLFNKLKSLNI